MSDRVTTELHDGVLDVCLNRPDKRNAIDSQMIDALHATLQRADLDAQVRVLLLRGNGPDFCAGADLAELLGSVDQSPEENVRDAERLGSVFVGMRELPKPVLAAVHGRALAGGCGLATAADLVIADAAATFGYPEIKRGFVPAMVMAMLVRAVGEPVAFDLMATGRDVPATEAQRMGLIARVAKSDVRGEAHEIARGFTGCSGTALALLKRELYEIGGRDFSAAIRLGAQVNATARTAPDFRTAVASFLNKT